MSQVKTIRKERLDWIATALYFSLVLVGWLMIFAAGHHPDDPISLFDLNTNHGKQVLFIIISIILFILFQFIDWKFWSSFAYPVFGISVLMLILVLLIGNTVKGATSWFSFSGFSLQPSEFAKFGTALALAAYLSYYRTNVNNIRHQALAYTIFLIPMTLILLQPDAGSALIFTAFVFVLFREGIPPWLPIIGITIGLLFALSLIFQPVQVVAILLLGVATIFIFNEKKKQPWFFALLIMLILSGVGFYANKNFEVLSLNTIFLLVTIIRAYANRAYRQVLILTPVLLFCVGFAFLSDYAFENVLELHQQDRINSWLQPSKCDPQGSLYQVLQSKIAIGSGGFEGKGFLKGTMTNLNYVPEQTTDFIFSTIGEEQGFIGSAAIIILYVLFILRIITIAERARANFIRQYAYGIAGIIFIHFFINIGMTLGIAPIIGIPLPFISYGGSSLIAFTIMIAALLKMDSSR